jgi:hypothetical protein
MTRRSRCVRMTGPKRHAAKGPGGKGMVGNLEQVETLWRFGKRITILFGFTANR